MPLFDPTVNTDEKGVTRVKPGSVVQQSYDACEQLFFNPLQAAVGEALGKPQHLGEKQSVYDPTRDGGGLWNPMNWLTEAAHYGHEAGSKAGTFFKDLY